MGELSRRDERALNQLLKRAQRLEDEAQYAQYGRQRREKLTAAKVYREEAEALRGRA